MLRRIQRFQTSLSIDDTISGFFLSGTVTWQRSHIRVLLILAEFGDVWTKITIYKVIVKKCGFMGRAIY